MSNETLDVLQYGCFLTYDSIACARSSFLGALVLVTLMFLAKASFNAGKMSKNATFESMAYQIFILLFAIFMSILCFVNWLLGAHLPQIDLAASCLKLIILINVLLIYGTKALRLVHREKYIAFVLAPICFCLGFYGLFVAVTGLNDVGSTQDECYKPYWIMLSAADVLLVLLITVSAIVVHKSASLIAIEKVIVSELLKRLWVFVAFLQISAVTTLAYDITVRILGSSEISCSGIFLHSQMIYSTVMTIFMTAKFLMPLWGFLYAFDRKSFITEPHETKIFVVTRGDHTYRVLTSRAGSYDDNNRLLARSVSQEPSTTQAIFGGLPMSGGSQSPQNQSVLNPKDYWRTRSKHSRGSTLSIITEGVGETSEGPSMREVVLEVHAEADA